MKGVKEKKNHPAVKELQQREREKKMSCIEGVEVERKKNVAGRELKVDKNV